MDVMTLSNLSYEDKMAAMDKRISSRAYLDQEIEEEKIDALKEAIDEGSWNFIKHVCRNISLLCDNLQRS